jgi:tetratricopeptide (TPR) repeat protein
LLTYQSYSEAIRIAETPEERHSALLNRSLVNLRLDRPEEALNDASAVVKDGKINEKSLYREARALYELRDFPQSLMKWQQLTKLYPQSLDARAEIMRTKERVREAETGDYNWASMYKQVEATPPFVDCANYVGPVAVRAIEGLGNGLFTTAPVKAGTLLICEKAFAYSFTSALDRSLSTQAEKELCETSFTNFTTKIVQKLYHSPRASQAFNDLHHGDYRPVDITQVDGKPVVDT